MKETIAAVRSALRVLEDRGGEPELCAALAAGLERIDEREREVKELVSVARIAAYLPTERVRPAATDALRTALKPFA